MAIRTTKLGNPFVREHPTYEDVNETITYLEKQEIGNAEIAYRVLQSNNTFTNGPNVVVDEFTDSNGTNNTVDSSTGQYDSTDDFYWLSWSDGTDIFVSTQYDDTSENESPTWTTLHNYTGIDSFIDTVDCETRGTYGDGSGTMPIRMTFTYDDATTYSQTLNTSGGTFTSKTYTNINKRKKVSSILVEWNWPGFEDTKYAQIRNFNANVKTIDSSSNVVIDTGVALDGNEELFTISVPDATFPDDTSITATLTDGTNSLPAATIDTVSKGVVIGNDGTLGSGTLGVTFTLSTTDEEVTPTLPGYAIKILR